MFGLGTRVDGVGPPPLSGAGGLVTFRLQQRGDGEVPRLGGGEVGNPPGAKKGLGGSEV